MATTKKTTSKNPPLKGVAVRPGDVPTRSEPQPNPPLRGSGGVEVMNIEELAVYLDLAVATIYQKVSERSIPFTKIRNILRFQKSTIDEWLLQNTVYPEPDTFEEFARWYSRHVFKEWIKSKGKKPQELSQKELNNLARQSLNDLLSEDS